MWKDYSISYIRNNKAASISIMAAIFISSVFISAISFIFYNTWTDGIWRIVDEEGGWHAKIVGTLTSEQLDRIAGEAAVDHIEVAEKTKGRQGADAAGDTAGAGTELVVSVYFANLRMVYKVLPEIMQRAGAAQTQTEIEYHTKLLSQYYVYSEEQKKDPPLLLSFYILVMLVVCFSLIMIIYHAFEITMGSRLHQFGILQTVGATPRQIRTALIQEALALGVLPVLAGSSAGVGIDYLFILYGNKIGDIAQRKDVEFIYSPWVLLVTVAVCLVTVLLAAWSAAGRLARVTPLDAVRNSAVQPQGKLRPYRLMSRIFGIEGELAGKSLFSRRKAYRTATISLTLSFLMFGFFLNFMTLSNLSTQYSYFERYKDSWDLMVTAEGEAAGREDLLERIRQIPEIADSTRYQKAKAYTWIDRSMLSDELIAIGGLEALNHTGIVADKERYKVELPLIILDDASYQAYCRQVGIRDGLPESDREMDLPAAVTINRIWDTVHSDFRARKYLPFIKTQQGQQIGLYSGTQADGQAGMELAVAGYTEQVPALREQYSYFSLVQVMSESAYTSITGRHPTVVEVEDSHIYYRLFADSEEGIDKAERTLEKLLNETNIEYKLENRKSEEAYNALAWDGLNKILGVFCGLLALVGVANVFANTVGGIMQRRREFARYLSIGLTPGSLKKILFAEALIVAVKPVLVIVPLNILFVVFAVYAKYDEFVNIMPIRPLVLMTLLVWLAVGCAYCISGRKVLQGNLMAFLKDDTFI